MTQDAHNTHNTESQETPNQDTPSHEKSGEQESSTQGIDKVAVAKGAFKLASGFGAKLFAKAATNENVMKAIIATDAVTKTATAAAKEKFAKATEGLDGKIIDAAAKAALKATEQGKALKGQATNTVSDYAEKVAKRMQEIEQERAPKPEKKKWSLFGPKK